MASVQRLPGAETRTAALDEVCFRAMAESATDMIAVLDADGRRLYVNPAMAGLFGDRSQLIGSDSLADIHPEDRTRLRELLHQVVDGGEGRRAEYRVIDHQGRVRFLESQSNVIATGEGPLRVVVVSRDVTERKRVERELHDLKLRFISMTNHELRTPLTTIRSSAELLRCYEQNFSASERQELLDDIGSAVVRMTGMIEQLLNISRSAS